MQEKYASVLITLVLLFISIALKAQQIQFQHINTDDGLSQNSVVSIAQDSTGFLWFATQDGLNKYDGSNFSQYEVFFKDITEKDNNELGKLMVDNQDRIWMTTLDGGLQYCQLSTEKFALIKGVKDASYTLQNDKKEFWVSSFSNGLYRVIIDQENIQTKNYLKNKSISKLISFGNEILLVTQNGIEKFDPQTQVATNLFTGIKNVSDVIINKDRTLLISTLGHGLYISDEEDNIMPYLDLPKSLLIQDIHRDKSNRLWIATYGQGLFMSENGKTTQFKTNPQDVTSISYNDILNIHEDKYGNLWFGTDGRGVSYIVAGQKKINGITTDRMPAGNPVDVVRAIITDLDDNIWIGTSGKGLTMLSSDMSTVKHFNTNGLGGSSITSNRIMSLLYDDRQDLWIGTQEGGLMRKKAGTEIFEAIKMNLPANTIWDIENADEGFLWLCTRNEGLILLNKKDLSGTKLSLRKGYEVLRSGNVRTIIKGPGDEYFVGTDDGEVFGVRTDSRLRKVILNRKNTGGIKSLLIDNGKLWVGTQQAGVIIVDFDTGKQIKLNKSSGLPNNVVYSILNQDENYVWISTNMGICQIDKKRAYQEDGNIVTQHLTAQNGLIGNEFNTGAYHVSKNGTMYFGGIDGFNWFDPDEISKDDEPIDIVLLDLIITNRDGQDIKHINNLSSIDLKHTERNFQVRYVAQSFAKTKTKYQYKLEGINAEWVDNESNELVSFSNIPPGDYTLLLNATNGDGVWADEPVRFEINIIPAFWQTLWFKILVVGASIWLVWYLFTKRVNEIRKTSALKEQITKVEAKALKLQMNPHFLFNSLNAIDNYILKNEKITASDYLSKFSKLMRQILDYSELGSITLSQELETLELYIKMERLRFQDKFDYKLNVSGDVDMDIVKLPPLILQPFVENAIWHGLLHRKDGGILKIDIVKSGAGTKCIIDDNGIGREKSNQIKSKSATKHKSHGIRITEERLNLNNELNKIGANIVIEDKYDKHGHPEGTKVTIHLPRK